MPKYPKVNILSLEFLFIVDRSGMVTKANIELVFTQVYQSQDYQNSKGKVGDVRKYVKIIDALSTPKFEYDVHSKTFVR